MFRKIIRNFIYSKKIKFLLNNHNLISNILLKSFSRFQRKFIKYESFNNNENDKILFNIKDLEKPGDKFVFGDGFDSSIDLKKFNSVAGYVPFRKNITSVMLYNFFSKNYAIRKQILGTIYYLKDNLKIYQQWFLLPIDCIKFLNASLKDFEADIVVIELFHNRLPKNHGGHDGHLRFHGIYSNSSTVHSMPIENYYIKKNNIRSLRKYIPYHLKTKDSHCNLVQTNLFEKKVFNLRETDLFGNVCKKIVGPLGFNLLESENSKKKRILSVFHDSEDTNYKYDERYDYQIIDLPKIKNINAILYFTEALESENEVILYFIDNLRNVRKKISTKVDNYSEINIRELYNDDLNDIIFIIVNILNKKSKRFINVFYAIGDMLCDSVHAQCLEDFSFFNSKPATITKSFQGLKWMHFPNQNNFQSYLTIINTDKLKMNFKLRVIFDDFNEHSIMYTQNYDTNQRGIIEINLNKLFLKEGLSLDKRGIIQLECRNYNPSANLFSYDLKEQTISVDHLTGG